ncbi:MAG: GntR family transcriptional regulator [Lachnospiraceae bacterium]|nr:GntR family transcriptional regulator [Lachnospiraceae bacterium]
MSKITDPSINTKIYKHIRDMILHREILQGEKIPELQIARDLSVSRTPVREAVRQLSWDGIITMEPNKSPTVRILDEDLIQDLAVVRWQHELLNIPMVIYNGSNKDFDELRQYAELAVMYNGQGDLNLRNKFDAKFHAKMFEIGGNRILLGLHNQLQLIVQLWQIYHISGSDTQVENLKRHLTIVEALSRRDSDEVIRLMYRHLAESYGVDFEKHK